MPVKIYGASDDLIEVEGDVREEFYSVTLNDDDDEGGLLAFSNGTVLRIVYTREGLWRITPVAGEVSVEQCIEETDDLYSDIAEVPGDIRWVVFGTQFVKS